MASSGWNAATAILHLCMLQLCVSYVPAAAQYGGGSEPAVPPPPADCRDCSLCETHCQPALPPPAAVPTTPPPPPPPALPSYGTPPPPACPPARVIQCCPYTPPSPYAYLPYYKYSSSPPPPQASLVLPLLAAPMAWAVASGFSRLGPIQIY